ncbi:Ku protein [Rhizobium laguerreae]|uniref:Ku protein n=1 Tax=Rhizobium laguerreae TaxID=1076926 RepID=UPI001442789D|nr:Ku protein [Rhizobium laguerreae]NKM36360.1 hypothetical protein [Rhizobium laguerreae]
MKITFLAAIAALFLGGAAATQAAEIDINGMALGMSADQVIAKFQAARPEAQYEFVRWKLPEGTEWVANGRTLYNDLANPNDMEHERMFRRMRTVLIRPHGKVLIATTLNFDYEVRPSDEAFKDVAKVKVEDEMLDLAKHIIDTKVGEFDPGKTDDRYETALAALVKAKAEGKALPKPKPIKVSKPNDLLKALRESAGIDKGSSKKPKAANANSGRKKGSTATSSKATTKTNHKKAS